MATRGRASTRTVLFTDVVGSTSLRAGRGDESAQQIMRAHLELVRRQIEQHGGHEVKAIGDGLMVAFTSARQAVDCAAGVQRALAVHNRRRPDDAVAVRIGINTGEVLEEGGDLFGMAVDAASRIAAKAKGGEILASEAVRSVIGPTADVRFADRGRFRLKGFPDRWRLCEVVWQDEAAPPAHVLLERTPFIGQEAESATLRRLLNQAGAGQGSLVLIGGEPGVGKTRLAEELMTEARKRDMTALMGRCYELEGSPPYIPFVEMLEAAARAFPLDALRDTLGESAPEVAKLVPELRKLYPDIDEPPELPPEQERRYLFNGVVDFLGRAARAQPLLLVFDDLHWADESTLLLLRHVADQLSGIPLLVTGTYRDVEVDETGLLARAMEELVRQRLAHRLSLKRLPEAGVESMLRAMSPSEAGEPPASLVGAIYGETEGNPFFVEEVFKHLSEDGKLFDISGANFRADLQVDELSVPETVRPVIERRLRRVSEECRSVLTAAAVVGRVFSFELLEAMGVLDADALLEAIDDAERSQLITAESDGAEAHFTFSHELIRQTLLASLSLPRRQRMHLAVAEAMELVYARDAEEHAADLAHHLQQAGSSAEPQKAVRYLTLAAEHALAQVAYEEAIRLYERALQAFDWMDAPAEAERCELLLGLGDAQVRAGQLLAGRQNFVLAAETSRAFRMPTQLARAALGHAGTGNEAGTVDEVRIALLEEALKTLDEADSALRATLMGELAQSLRWYFDSGNRRRQLARDAVEMARRLGDSTALASTLAAMHIAIRAPGDLDERVEAAREVINLGHKVRNDSLVAAGYEALVDDLAQLGDIRRAGTAVESLDVLAEKLRHPYYLWSAAAYRAELAILGGQFKEAEEFATQASALGKAAQHPAAQQNHASHLFMLHWLQGCLGDVDLIASRRFADRYPAYANVHVIRAIICDQLGLDREARAEYELLVSHNFAMILSGINHRFVLSLLAEPCASLGDVHRAPDVYGLLLPYTLENNILLGSLSRNLGALAATMRRWDDAERHFQDALAMNERMGARPWAAWTQHDYAAMLLKRHRKGDRQRALELLTPALAAAQEMGMKRLEEKAQALLDALQGVAPALPAGLSEREVEVLRLLAAGKSNQDIAEALVISQNTVIRHVSTIYTKTGAANRVEAAAFASKHGLA